MATLFLRDDTTPTETEPVRDLERLHENSPEVTSALTRGFLRCALASPPATSSGPPELLLDTGRLPMSKGKAGRSVQPGKARNSDSPECVVLRRRRTAELAVT